MYNSVHWNKAKKNEKKNDVFSQNLRSKYAGARTSSRSHPLFESFMNRPWALRHLKFEEFKKLAEEQ